MSDTVFGCANRPRAGFNPVLAIIRSACSLLVVAESRFRQRLALAALDGRLLDDLGLSRTDVRRECAKSWLIRLAGPT